jgi:hypothetical protein
MSMYRELPWIRYCTTGLPDRHGTAGNVRITLFPTGALPHLSPEESTQKEPAVIQQSPDRGLKIYLPVYVSSTIINSFL